MRLVIVLFMSTHLAESPKKGMLRGEDPENNRVANIFVVSQLPDLQNWPPLGLYCMAKEAIIKKTGEPVKVYTWRANPTPDKPIYINADDCKTQYQPDELEFKK